jgi:mRNA-degrading endonuclease toxin of MazEF toxin-antitoxin module
MPDAGDIYLADVNDEIRRKVLVISNGRFHELALRAFVLPMASPRPYPWRIAHDDTVYAADLLQTIPTDRLLELQGRAPQSVVRRARQAIRHISM